MAQNLYTKWTIFCSNRALFISNMSAKNNIPQNLRIVLTGILENGKTIKNSGNIANEVMNYANALFYV